MRRLLLAFAVALVAASADAEVRCTGTPCGGAGSASTPAAGLTANTVVKATSGSVLGDSTITDNGTIVTVGAASGINLTNADTTLSRSAAGKLAVEGVDVAYDDSFTTVTVIEEFTGGSTSTAAVGSHGLSTTALSTGTHGSITGTTAMTGLLRFNSHATNDNSGDIVAIAAQATFGGDGAQTVWTATDWSLDVIFKPGSNGTAITNIGMFIGIAAAFNSDPMAGAGSVGVRFDSDRSDAVFTFVTCDSSTAGCGSNGDDTNQKVVVSTITPVGGTNYRFRIRRAASGVGGNPTIYMRVNNETEKTFCSSGCDDLATEIPAGTVAMAPVFFYVTRTTTGVLSGDMDYVKLKIPNIPARY